jgi:excisionase family DNA binding protein
MCNKPYLTPQELAERLQVSVECLYSLLGCPGGIRAIKVGNGPRARWRIPVQWVEEWQNRKSLPSSSGQNSK